VSAEPNNRKRTELRKKFDTVVKNLPKLKGNPFAPEASSKVAAWIDITFSNIKNHHHRKGRAVKVNS
jgi:hypothetical protein